MPTTLLTVNFLALLIRDGWNCLKDRVDSELRSTAVHICKPLTSVPEHLMPFCCICQLYLNESRKYFKNIMRRLLQARFFTEIFCFSLWIFPNYRVAFHAETKNPTVTLTKVSGMTEV